MLYFYSYALCCTFISRLYKNLVAKLENHTFFWFRLAQRMEGCEELGSVLDEVTYLRLAGLLDHTVLGFFTVNRSTLTGLLSTIITYLIILIQFDQNSAKL